jgi:Pvc16 N-terminal domain
LTDTQIYDARTLPLQPTTGELIQAQQLGLNLYYLLTVYGANNDDDLLAHRLLASAMRVLDENPILNGQIIGNAIRSVAGADDNVDSSDLANQIDRVKLSFYNPSFDEIAKLWSSLFQTHYRLSVVYEATLVLLDWKQQPSKPVIPVQERQIYATTSIKSIIEKVDPEIVQYSSNADERTVTLLGQNLGTEGAIIQIDGSTVVPNEDILAILDDKISFVIPENLSPGIKQIQITYKQNLPSESLSPITAAAAKELGPKTIQSF